jgi:hypothetical protein
MEDCRMKQADLMDRPSTLRNRYHAERKQLSKGVGDFVSSFGWQLPCSNWVGVYHVDGGFCLVLRGPEMVHTES